MDVEEFGDLCSETLEATDDRDVTCPGLLPHCEEGTTGRKDRRGDAMASN